MEENNLCERQSEESKNQSLRELCQQTAAICSIAFTLSALESLGIVTAPKIDDGELKNLILELKESNYIDHIIEAFKIRVMDEKRPIIISGYPGIGKSYLSEKTQLITHGIFDFEISDSDSSNYSWTTDESGNKIRNPEFPENYIRHIKDLMKTSQIILVSTHKQVRDAMDEAGIDYYIVYPEKEFPKSEYMERFRKRGSSEEFIKVQDENWDKWIDDLNNDQVHIGYSLDNKWIPYLDISTIASLSYIESELNNVKTRKEFLEKMNKGE